MLYICPPPWQRGQDPCVGITIQVLLSVYVHMYTLLSPPGHADPTAPAAAAPLSTSQPRTTVWEWEEEGNHSDVAHAPSAPLLYPEQVPALGIPCARFIAHFASGLHFNPTFHSPGVLSLQQAEDRAHCARPPPAQHPHPRTQSPAGCWLERAAGMTHYRCSLWGQGRPDKGTETMQRVGEWEQEEGKIKDEKGRTDLRRRKNAAWQVLKASCFLVLFL